MTTEARDFGGTEANGGRANGANDSLLLSSKRSALLIKETAHKEARAKQSSKVSQRTFANEIGDTESFPWL